MGKRLYKSSRDKVLAGVCGGIGEYFDVDPVLIRILWVVSAFFGGVGLLAYIIAAIIMPNQEEPDRQGAYGQTYKRTEQAYSAGGSASSGGRPGTDGSKTGASTGSKDRDGRHHGTDGGKNVLAGAILISMGAFFFLREFMPWISGGVLVSVMFISLGIFLLVRRNGEEK